LADARKAHEEGSEFDENAPAADVGNTLADRHSRRNLVASASCQKQKWARDGLTLSLSTLTEGPEVKSLRSKRSRNAALSTFPCERELAGAFRVRIR